MVRNYLRVRGEYPSNRCWWGDTRNYLRVRGEYVSCAKRSLVNLELPPRARRIP